MGIGRAWISRPIRALPPALPACLCAGALLLLSALAAAQEPVRPSPAAQPPEGRGLFNSFSSFSRWFDEQAARVHSTFRDAGRQVEDFSRDAGVAARNTASGAKDAADVVARIPRTRVVSGHAKCLTAPNGAPDCLGAADAVCQAKGFSFGKSVDMTTAEVCPPKVYMSGRSGGAGCTTETFVSRALCQ